MLWILIQITKRSWQSELEQYLVVNKVVVIIIHSWFPAECQGIVRNDFCNFWDWRRFSWKSRDEVLQTFKFSAWLRFKKILKIFRE